MASTSEKFHHPLLQEDPNIEDDHNERMAALRERLKTKTIRQLNESLKRRGIDLKIPPELLDSDIN
jgi:hypothetical protein